jgi:hypothetical protein
MRIALLTLVLLTAVPAEAARDVFVRDSPKSAAATCLRATGAPGLMGLLGPLEGRTFPYDLLRVDAGGVSVAATTRLGILAECPAVAADPTGHAVVAGTVRTGRRAVLMRAALAEPGGGFAAPVDIGRARGLPSTPVAAISPRGDAVVAWSTLRLVRRSGRLVTRTGVVAALRPAGGSFGRARLLASGGRMTFPREAQVTAGMDTSGTATVAWAQPVPDRANISAVSRVAVATAPAGGALRPAQILARRVQFVGRAALSVTPDGRALFAHDGQGAVWVYERAAGESDFVRIRRLGSGRDWQDPDVAVASDGSAVVAWRGGEAVGSEDVLVVSRRGTGPWTGPVVLQRRRRDDLSLGDFGVSLAERVGGRPEPPDDPDNTSLRAAIGPDGRYLVSWGWERRLPFGDRPLGARMVQGVAGGGASRLETAGCACRSVNGVVPLESAGGDLLVAYTDNVTWALDLQVARRSGRLHLADAGPPGPGLEPPRLSVRRPRATTLGYGNRLRVRVGCDRPCDLRAYVVGGRGRARGAASGSLRRAGSRLLAIEPGPSAHLAPPSGRRARVVVRGFATDGRRFVTRTVRVELHRKPLRPLPRLLNPRASMRGRSVVVTWQTDRPARRVQFVAVLRHPRRRGDPTTTKFVEGRGRRSFRVRFAGPADSVAVSVIRNRPPYDSRTVVVPLSR